MKAKDYFNPNLDVVEVFGSETNELIIIAYIAIKEGVAMDCDEIRLHRNGFVFYKKGNIIGRHYERKWFDYIPFFSMVYNDLIARIMVNLKIAYTKDEQFRRVVDWHETPYEIRLILE